MAGDWDSLLINGKLQRYSQLVHQELAHVDIEQFNIIRFLYWDND